MAGARVAVIPKRTNPNGRLEGGSWVLMTVSPDSIRNDARKRRSPLFARGLYSETSGFHRDCVSSGKRSRRNSPGNGRQVVAGSLVWLFALPPDNGTTLRRSDPRPDWSNYCQACAE